MMGWIEKVKCLFGFHATETPRPTRPPACAVCGGTGWQTFEVEMIFPPASPLKIQRPCRICMTTGVVPAVVARRQDGICVLAAHQRYALAARARRN